MITFDAHKSGGTIVMAEHHTLGIFTAETPKAAVDKFIELCKARETELVELGREYVAKVAWNHANRGKGKNWPVFTKMEKIVKQLCKQAGIVDS